MKQDVLHTDKIIQQFLESRSIALKGVRETYIVLVDSPIRKLQDRKGVDVDGDGLAGCVEAGTLGQNRGDVILMFVSINVQVTKLRLVPFEAKT